MPTPTDRAWRRRWRCSTSPRGWRPRSGPPTRVSLDVERLARLAPAVEPGLRVLTGIPGRAGGRNCDRPGWRSSGEVARELAAWTVVDCGFGLETDEEVSFDVAVPRRNGATLCTLAEADVVLAVGSADPIGLNRLVRGLQDLREVLPPGVPAGWW